MDFARPDDAMQQWTIGISHGDDLKFCLYVRDIFNLEPAVTPQIPALIPAVRRSSAVTDDLRQELEAPWTRWWTELLRAKGGGQRRKLGEDPDAFPELDDSPELFEAAWKVSPDGHAWAEARKRDFFKIFKSTQGRPLATGSAWCFPARRLGSSSGYQSETTLPTAAFMSSRSM
jgi:hypothetical protein